MCTLPAGDTAPACVPSTPPCRLRFLDDSAAASMFGRTCVLDVDQRVLQSAGKEEHRDVGRSISNLIDRNLTLGNLAEQRSPTKLVVGLSQLLVWSLDRQNKLGQLHGP